MSLTFKHFPSSSQDRSTKSKNIMQDKFKDFLHTINTPEHGFFYLMDDEEQLQSSKEVYLHFSKKKTFVHVGIGGSSLGAEMLLGALSKSHNHNNSDCEFHFLNNVDPHSFQKILGKIDIQSTLFYFVSKSGDTAETLAAWIVITNWLTDNQIPAKDFKNYIVVATDPEKGTLRKLQGELGLMGLKIRPNIGGRFSALSSVGILPALFAGIDMKKLLLGARTQAKIIVDEGIHSINGENGLLEMADFIYRQKRLYGINQTVLMPYCDRLKNFSSWFVQLWAESLGKKENHQNELVWEGLTPIGALGATDQHSQLQLFAHGPHDKCFIFIEVKNSNSNSNSNSRENKSINFSLNSHFSEYSKIEAFRDLNLQDLIQAEMEGTISALKELSRPIIQISMDECDEFHLGQLIIYFESLTVLMGHYFNVNPFDQPGVESSKKFTHLWLEKSRNDPS
jgi:glucose-6-phosphate isomerase